jgi:hypothetical protein
MIVGVGRGRLNEKCLNFTVDREIRAFFEKSKLVVANCKCLISGNRPFAAGQNFKAKVSYAAVAVVGPRR